jgi:hypothetical protein
MNPNAEQVIATRFEGEGEAWSDKLSGDRLARIAVEALEQAGILPRPTAKVLVCMSCGVMPDEIPATDHPWQVGMQATIKVEDHEFYVAPHRRDCTRLTRSTVI